jgi:FlaA1/EpsC-like NDP-sugar epimerase
MVVRMRNRFLLLLDLLLLAPLPFVAVALYQGSVPWPPALLDSVRLYAIIALAIRIGALLWSGVYRCMWRYASIDELQRLLVAGALSSVAAFVAGYVVLPAVTGAALHLPIGGMVFDAFMAIGLVVTPRMTIRFLGGKSRNLKPTNSRRVLLVGAGTLGQAILREAHANPYMRLDVVGIVDDDPQKAAHTLSGVSVVGTLADIAAQVAKLGVQEVLIAIPSAKGHVIRRIVQQAALAGVPTRIVPGMEDVVSGRVRMQTLRKVEIHDLLRREPVATDVESVRALISGQVVLVTGAGGSIGSELCRQIAALQPSKLVALDHSENLIFEIDREIREHHAGVSFDAVIANIRDDARVREIFGRCTPSIVFHAAAHKHVPLMEKHIIEAVTTNVLGTQTVVDAALDSGTQHFVLISTDKAVRPTSIMGATKRIAEQIVQRAALAEHRSFVSVRFGNVLASRGSVIPTFMRQIEEGGPVTVTHPEMRRYFMTIPEAVQLVLQAGALGKGDELFVLDMGEPVKIVDLAKDLIRLSGLEVGPDIEIVYTGIRPGEKLFEDVLFGDEEVFSTPHPKVLRTTASAPAAGFDDALEELIRHVSISPVDLGVARGLLCGLVPDFCRGEGGARRESKQGSARAVAVVKDRISS